MSNADIKKYTTALVEILTAIEDKKIEAKALIEAAENNGLDGKALAATAKEWLMDSEKLRKKIEKQDQLDLFRSQSGLLKAKGLDGDLREAAE